MQGLRKFDPRGCPNGLLRRKGVRLIEQFELVLYVHVRQLRFGSSVGAVWCLTGCPDSAYWGSDELFRRTPEADIPRDAMTKENLATSTFIPHILSVGFLFLGDTSSPSHPHTHTLTLQSDSAVDVGKSSWNVDFVAIYGASAHFACLQSSYFTEYTSWDSCRSILPRILQSLFLSLSQIFVAIFVILAL